MIGFKKKRKKSLRAIIGYIRLLWKNPIYWNSDRAGSVIIFLFYVIVAECRRLNYIYRALANSQKVTKRLGLFNLLHMLFSGADLYARA